MRGFFLLLNFVEYSLEGFGVELGERGEDLAVEFDVGLLEETHKDRIGRTFYAHCCIDASIPEFASITLFVAAVCKCVASSVCDRVLCHALLGRTSKTVAFYLRKDVLSALICNCSSLYSCHGIEIIW